MWKQTLFLANRRIIDMRKRRRQEEEEEKRRRGEERRRRREEEEKRGRVERKLFLFLLRGVQVKRENSVF